jgi:hypothetical protein
MREQAAIPNGWARDFEADVLEQLVKHGACYHGCSVQRVKANIDGSVSAFFAGVRDGIEWEGGLRFNLPLLQEKKWLGDSTAMAETILKVLNGVAKPAPLLVKAH